MRDFLRSALLILFLIFSACWAFAEFDFDFLEDDEAELVSLADETRTEPRLRMNFVFEEYLKHSAKNNKISEIYIPEDFFNNWSNRVTLSVKSGMKITDNLAASLYTRFNHMSDNQNNFDKGKTNTDINELYFRYNFNSFNIFDVGRINVKTGAALGFNPSDFLKEYSGNEKIYDDPVELRENRLGTVMARYNNINKFGAVSVIAVPKIKEKAFDINKTNSKEKFILKIALNTFDNVQPELVYIFEEKNSGFAASASSVIGDNIIAYAEWAGMKRYNILMETILEYCDKYGISRDLPKTQLPDFITEKKFRNQAAAGFSYTESKYKRTTYIEYHYNEDGVDFWTMRNHSVGDYYSEIKEYFPEIAYYRADYYLNWATRDNANKLMAPYNKHQLFLRNHWHEAFHNKVNIYTMLQYNLNDKSSYGNLKFEYNYSSSLIFDIIGALYSGGRETEYGGLPEKYSVKTGLSYYF